MRGRLRRAKTLVYRSTLSNGTADSRGAMLCAAGLFDIAAPGGQKIPTSSSLLLGDPTGSQAR
jgi:hypothetical protein